MHGRNFSYLDDLTTLLKATTAEPFLFFRETHSRLELKNIFGEKVILKVGNRCRISVSTFSSAKRALLQAIMNCRSASFATSMSSKLLAANLPNVVRSSIVQTLSTTSLRMSEYRIERDTFGNTFHVLWLVILKTIQLLRTLRVYFVEGLHLDHK